MNSPSSLGYGFSVFELSAAIILIHMLIEALPGQWSEHERLQDLFSLHLPLKAKSVLFDSAFIQPVIPGTEGKVLRYVCKETDERNVSMDYYATDWIL